VTQHRRCVIRYTNLLKHKCLHVNGLVAGVVAIHGGGMMLIQQKFLDEYDEICEQLMDLEAKVCCSLRPAFTSDRIFQSHPLR